MLIPIARTADVAQIERIRPLVEGRHCVVVGSAPLPTRLADIAADEIAIAVNGAISSLPGPADLWVLNSKQQDRPGDPRLTPLHKTMLEQGRGRTAEHLLLLRGPKVASERGTRTTLDALGMRYRSWSVLDKVTKRWVEGEQCGRVLDARPCSSGLLTVALTLWCGAARVRLLGFSFTPGYHYVSKAQAPAWWRDHVEADRRALKALRARYGVRLEGDLVVAVAA